MFRHNMCHGKGRMAYSVQTSKFVEVGVLTEDKQEYLQYKA